MKFYKRTSRIFALDVFRGLAIVIMIIVDAPPDRIYSLLSHAGWEGITIADLAFPGFVLSMGMSAAISAARRPPSTKKILRRTAILFLLGIFMNTLPFIFLFFMLDNVTGADFFARAVEHGRFFGILQRLALAYALGMLLANAIKSDKGIFAAAIGLLIISSAGFHLYNPAAPFDEAHNISRAVDYILPGSNHIYTPTHDPEGLYGTLSSAAHMLLGFLAGRILADNAFLRDKIYLLILFGAILLIIGGLWSFTDIIAKKIWTSPFTLINSGGGMILLALLLKIFNDFPQTKKFFNPLSSLGKNPLFFFLASNIMLIFFWCLPSPDGIPMWLWIWQKTFHDVISTEFGVTIFCIAWCLLWLPIAQIFDRLGIVIKI